MKRNDDQIKFPLRILHPAHSMDRRFVVQFDRAPFLSPIRGRNQIEDGPTVDRIARVPSSPDGNFSLAIAINVRGRDANMIELREVLGDDMFLPGWILVPGDLILSTSTMSG